jgi:Icc-related predicted phosphoesterase
MVIHAGDASNNIAPTINVAEYTKFDKWFSNLDIQHKIFVPGNHETAMYNKLIAEQTANYHILTHESIVIEDIKFFGSPYTMSYGNWAYMVPVERIEMVWSDIPEDCDVLITHGAPVRTLSANNKGIECGDHYLSEKVNSIKPKYHIFGHIHESSGMTIKNDIVFINASCTLNSKGKYNMISNGYVIEI